MNAQRIKLNIIPGGVPPIVHVSQYDKGRTLEFALYDGTTVANIESGTEIDIRGTKPDDTGFSYPCTYANNIVTVTTQIQMTAVAGSFDCELHIAKGIQEIGTANFILEVEPSALKGETIDSVSDIPAIVEAARNNQLTDEAIQNAINSATAAANSATRAASSESVATQKAQDATDSASAASTSASAAADSASAAASASASAETKELNAQRAAGSAETFANSAAASAQRAAASAQRALENVTGATVFSGSDAGLVPPNTKGTDAILHGDGKWYSYTSADVVNIYASGNAIFVTLLSNAKTAIPKDTYVWVYETASKCRMYLCKTTKNIEKGEQFGLTNEPVGGNNLKFVSLLDEIESMKTSFQSGVDTIYNAFVAKRVTPTASTPSALATAVGKTYNKGVTDAESNTWTFGVACRGGSNDDKDYEYDLKNVQSFVTSHIDTNGPTPTCRYYNSAGTQISFFTPVENTTYIPTSEKVRLVVHCPKKGSYTKNSNVYIEFTNQTKILR